MWVRFPLPAPKMRIMFTNEQITSVENIRSKMGDIETSLFGNKVDKFISTNHRGRISEQLRTDEYVVDYFVRICPFDYSAENVYGTFENCPPNGHPTIFLTVLTNKRLRNIPSFKAKPTNLEFSNNFAVTRKDNTIHVCGPTFSREYRGVLDPDRMVKSLERVIQMHAQVTSKQMVEVRSHLEEFLRGNVGWDLTTCHIKDTLVAMV